MKKILYALVYLYPREWRDRYEQEFRALLDDAQPRWKDAFDIAKQGFAVQLRNGLLLTPLAFGAAAALIAVAVLRIPNPPYESHAVLSVKTYDQRIGRTTAFRSLSARMLSSESLSTMMETSHLYAEDRARGQTGKAVEEMRKSIFVGSSLLEPPPLGYVSITYHNQDPQIAQQVTQDLVARFIDENVRATQLGVGTVELIEPASPGRRPQVLPQGKVRKVIGIALAEGLQLGLIIALFRRRKPVGQVPDLPRA